MRWQDYIPFFQTPKMAVVKDERLRIIVLFLYAAVIAFVIILTHNTKAYQIALAPSGLFYSYWLEKANMTNVVSQFKQGTETPDYCKYPEAYNYDYGTGWSYFDYLCVPLGYSELYQKGENLLFVMTYFDDTHVEVGPCDIIQNCNYTTNDSLDPRHWQWTFEDYGDGTCSCGKKQSYFTVGADDMNFVFTHRAYVHHKGKTVFEGGSSGNVTTIIKNPYGDDLVVDSMYIKLPIKTWLKFAGIDLDSDQPREGAGLSGDAPWVCGYEENVSESCEQNGPNNGAKWRVSGLKIILDLQYSGGILDAFGNGEVICTINVRVGHGWNAMGSQLTYENIGKLPVSYIDDEATDEEDDPTILKYRDRYRYGIKFEISHGGELKWVDYFSINLCIVAMMVYLNLVPSIALYIANNFMKNSDIYAKHIVDEGRTSIRLQLENRHKKESLLNAITNLSSNNNCALSKSILEKDTFIELAKVEGFGSESSKVWPFQANKIDVKTLIKETEENPDSLFSLTIGELVKKKEEIGTEIMISCNDVPSISGVYTKICDDPLEYTCGNGINTVRLVKTREWRLMYVNLDAATNTNTQNVIHTLMSSDGELFGSRLWENAKMSWKKKHRIRVIPNYKTKNTENLCMELFQHFDSDKTFTISHVEFVQILERWNISISEEVADFMWLSMDKDKRHLISFETWFDYLKPYIARCAKGTGIANIFKLVTIEIENELKCRRSIRPNVRAVPSMRLSAQFHERLDPNTGNIYNDKDDTKTNEQWKSMFDKKVKHSISKFKESLVTQMQAKTIEVKPGPLGIGFNDIEKGTIQELSEHCQPILKTNGINEHWKLYAVGHNPYSFPVLTKYINGNENYKLTFQFQSPRSELATIKIEQHEI